MQPELLLFDIGNTSIKIGLAHERQVVTSYTLRTDAGQTADDLGLKLITLLGHAGITPQSLRACVASSVANWHRSARSAVCWWSTIRTFSPG